MTLTLEIAPEIERALEMKARRRGLDVAALLVELARREAAAPDSDGTADTGAAFLALTAELMPVIEAGTVASIGTIGPTELLDAVREERDAELTDFAGAVCRLNVSHA